MFMKVLYSKFKGVWLPSTVLQIIYVLSLKCSKNHSLKSSLIIDLLALVA